MHYHALVHALPSTCACVTKDLNAEALSDGSELGFACFLKERIHLEKIDSSVWVRDIVNFFVMHSILFVCIVLMCVIMKVHRATKGKHLIFIVAVEIE